MLQLSSAVVHLSESTCICLKFSHVHRQNVSSMSVVEKDGHTDHYVARVNCGSRLLWHVVSDHFHVMFNFPMFTIFPKLSMYINLQI